MNLRSVNDFTTFLDHYEKLYPLETSSMCLFRSALAEYGESFLNHRASRGHLTASSCIMDAEQKHTLLIFHPKIKLWLQPGGHVEANEEPLAAAQREVDEECGLGDLELVSHLPIDIDVHEIPAGKDRAHQHFDLRYLWKSKSSDLNPTAELDCRWVPVAEIAKWTQEKSLLRLIQKACEPRARPFK